MVDEPCSILVNRSLVDIEASNTRLGTFLIMKLLLCSYTDTEGTRMSPLEECRSQRSLWQLNQHRTAEDLQTDAHFRLHWRPTASHTLLSGCRATSTALAKAPTRSKPQHGLEICRYIRSQSYESDS